MAHSEKEVPMHKKLKYLELCIAQESWEDAAGHLCDLLEYCRTEINKNRMGLLFSDVSAAAEYYGKNLIPIKKGK